MSRLDSRSSTMYVLHHVHMMGCKLNLQKLHQKRLVFPSIVDDSDVRCTLHACAGRAVPPRVRLVHARMMQ